MSTTITLWGQTTNWLEIAAMLTGLAGVWLTVRENVWCFPMGILNVTLYAWLFYTPEVRLYADALLQCIYIVLLVYGWVKWSGKKGDKKISESKPVFMLRQEWISASLFTLMGIVLLGLFFEKYTNASLPWLDSSLTCLSLAAQWMIARKKIENWLLWIIADLVYVPLYLYKGLPLTAVLYALFFFMAILGWKNWMKNLKSSTV